ncbi:hypothetical protein DESUT3_06510 [Desulfuromonas versatilis]|uniref:UspA domain-containing protein n=1 Tax=Desulfuromonas versatilis TaxID=2802975 RepID=A0ABN6DTZ3_9BACT|nr:universal stress protein [Desulfuromonas versatilis]BCR03582.1 hypothetical protein DESUT3_06510 [Desulfuromonas versatilis]
MTKLKTILVASDLSVNADSAIRRAALLAKQSGAKLELLHVLEDWPWEAPDSLQLPPEPLLRLLTDEAREMLQEQADRTAGDGLRLDLRVEAGRGFVGIIRRARKIGADLIVVGAHGRRSMRDLFLGTTAEKVARKGDRPVLVVKTPAETPYRRVLAPTDFSEASRRAFFTALDLAPDASFDLLHVYRLWGAGRLSLATIGDEGLQRYHRQLLEKAETQMKEYLHDVNLGTRRLKRHLRQGHPPSLIPAQAAELGVDLVAVGTEGLSGLPYLLLGSVAEHVMRHAECDVLAVKPSNFRFQLP